MQLFHTIITSGKDNCDIEIVRKVKMINAMSIIATLIIVPLGFVDLVKGYYVIGIFVHIIAVVLIFNLIYLRKSDNYMFPIYCGTSIVAAYYIYALITGGVNNTGYLWFFTFPLFALFLLGSKKGIIASLLLIILSIVFFSIRLDYSTFTTYSTHFKIRFILSYLVVSLFAYLYETLREKTQRILSTTNAELHHTVADLRDTEWKLKKSSEELEKKVIERTNKIAYTLKRLKKELKHRKQAEDALKKNEVQKKAILDASVDRIRLVDKDLRIIWANKTTTKELGLDPEEIIGKTCYEVLVGRNTPCPGCPAVKSIKTGRIEQTVMHKTESKTIKGEVYWDSYGVPIKDDSGNIVHIIEITRNITERKLIEEALRHERDKLRDALDNIKTLRGLIPICAHCKKIRDDKGYWNQIESYIRDHSEADFSHSICPQCQKELYPDYYEDDASNQ